MTVDEARTIDSCTKTERTGTHQKNPGGEDSVPKRSEEKLSKKEVILKPVRKTRQLARLEPLRTTALGFESCKKN